MAYSVIILTTPTYETFQKFNEKKLWRLTIIFQQIIFVIKLYVTKATDLWLFWIICWKTIVNLLPP